MIEVIKIKNYALIEDAEIELISGLNVITGETGAGKSLFINALSLIMGEKSSNQIIGKNGKEASVEAVVHVDSRISKLLEKFEIDHKDTIVIKRIIGEKNRCYIDGNIVSQAQLKETMSSFLDICSQHENQSLLDKKVQREIVDSFSKNEKDLDKLKELFGDKRRLEQEIANKTREKQLNESQRDYLDFQLSEIKSLNINKDDEKIDEIISKLNNSVKIKEIEEHLSENLYGQEGIKSKLKESLLLIKQLDDLLNRNDSEAFKPQVAEFLNLIDNLPKKSISIDEESVNYYLQRNEELSKLKRKYGSILGVVEKREELESKLSLIDNFESDIESIEKQLTQANKEYNLVAGRVSKIRKENAKKLEKLIEGNLKELNMPHSKFSISISDTDPSEFGLDEIDFLISPNRAEELKKLAQIASGGELSRVILAVRNVSNKSKQCYLFDEVDSGIGGDTASMIGRKLKQMSNDRQVICITHLPQVAVFGEGNYKIEKIQDKNKTTSKIEKISHDNLVKEISRMLGSSLSGNKAIDNAKEMIKNAR